MFTVNPRKILKSYAGQTPYTKPDQPKGPRQRRKEARDALREKLRGTDLVNPEALK